SQALSVESATLPRGGDIRPRIAATPGRPGSEIWIGLAPARVTWTRSPASGASDGRAETEALPENGVVGSSAAPSVPTAVTASDPSAIAMVRLLTVTVAGPSPASVAGPVRV